MISEMFNHARECARYATNCQRCSGANCILSPLAPFQQQRQGTRNVTGHAVAINQFESLDAVQMWRSSDQFKEARKIGDKYAKFRAFAVEGLPQ
jgi:hypothetical protein